MCTDSGMMIFVIFDPWAKLVYFPLAWTLPPFPILVTLHRLGIFCRPDLGEDMTNCFYRGTLVLWLLVCDHVQSSWSNDQVCVVLFYFSWLQLICVLYICCSFCLVHWHLCGKIELLIDSGIHWLHILFAPVCFNVTSTLFLKFEILNIYFIIWLSKLSELF
jgi:hypothetical protein